MINSILLQAPAGGMQTMAPQLLMMVGIVAVFYFFMIRPQQKKQKETRNMISALKEGDSVVTIGGLHGKVHAVEENEITLVIDKGVKLTFEKSSIARVIK
jgi:preprotein translocase subunit YajC